MPNYTIQCTKCEHQEMIFRNLSEHGNWPRHCGKIMHQVYGATHVMPDIEPFQSVVVDVRGGLPVIGSRARLREFERDNNVRQVGTDLKATPKPYEAPPPVREDLKRAVHEVMSRKR